MKIVANFVQAVKALPRRLSDPRTKKIALVALKVFGLICIAALFGAITLGSGGASFAIAGAVLGGATVLITAIANRLLTAGP